MRQSIIKIATIILSALIICSFVYITRKDNSIQTKISSPSAVNGEWIDWTRNGDWCYKKADGTWAKNEYINGYWLDGAGWYDNSWDCYWDNDSTGWWYHGKNKYYPRNTWLKIDGAWYYFKDSGYMAANEWIGNYYLTNTGAMATNTWIGQYYVGSDGAWIPGYTDPRDNNTSGSSNNSNSSNSSNSGSGSNNNTNSNSSSGNNSNSNTNNTSNGSSNTNTNNNTSTKTTYYKVFVPNFSNENTHVPIAGYTQGGYEIPTAGYIDYHYVVCNTCKKKYGSYAEYRKNDTCSIETFTDKDTVGYWQNGVIKYESKYNYYFGTWNEKDVKVRMGSPEHIETMYVQCSCGELFKTGKELGEHTTLTKHGGSSNNHIETTTTEHYPELISTWTE